MRLARLGAFHQTRLSFLRAMLRHVRAAGFRFGYERWEIGDDGVGVAVYAARGPDRTYSLVCFAHDLDPAMRTDRVIAEAWDATYVLYDGIPDDGEIERLRANTPKQEAGRFRHTDLILSRTNKSARLFDHVVGCLAAGRQPEAARLDDVGYVMRTTAVYGNGKFGIADRHRYAGRPGFGGPFRMEMLTVWMIRQFVADLVDRMARVEGAAGAVPLDRALRRRLGIGNSTGLGLGPFIVNHPALFARWIECRELALARVRAQPTATEESWAAFREWIERARAEVAGWVVPDPIQAEKISRLAADLDRLASYTDDFGADTAEPWAKICDWAARTLSLEGQELTVSLAIEPHGALVDDLADRMAIDQPDPMPVGMPGDVGVFSAGSRTGTPGRWSRTIRRPMPRRASGMSRPTSWSHGWANGGRNRAPRWKCRWRPAAISPPVMRTCGERPETNRLPISCSAIRNTATSSAVSAIRTWGGTARFATT